MAETDGFGSDAEQAAVLALAPILRDFMRDPEAKLPPGTDIGIIIAPPFKDTRGEARILALTTDRHRVAFLAAQWCLSVRDTPDPDFARILKAEEKRQRRAAREGRRDA